MCEYWKQFQVHIRLCFRPVKLRKGSLHLMSLLQGENTEIFMRSHLCHCALIWKLPLVKADAVLGKPQGMRTVLTNSDQICSSGLIQDHAEHSIFESFLMESGKWIPLVRHHDLRLHAYRIICVLKHPSNFIQRCESGHSLYI